MKSDYWNVSNEQVLEKTGQHIQHWMKLLDEFDAANKKSNDVVAFTATKRSKILGAYSYHFLLKAKRRLMTI